MMIIVKIPAMEQLQKLNLKENEGIRILSDVEGGCSMYVNYSLVVDQKRTDDIVVTSGDIDFLVNERVKWNLPEKVYIAYTGNGYKLYTDEEILQTDIQIK